MPSTTAGWSIPYPTPADPVDFNGDLAALADSVDFSLTFVEGEVNTVAANLAIVTADVATGAGDIAAVAADVATLNGQIEERSMDAVAGAIAAGTRTGMTIVYTDGTNSFDFAVTSSPSASPIVLGTVYGLAGATNTGIGYSAMSSLTTGVNSSGFGYDAQPSSASASNEITLGNSAVTILRSQATTITSLSDGRDKRLVEDIPAGLAFINSLRPVKFEWNMRDKARIGEFDMGFIAQDLAKAEDSIGGHDWLRLTHRDNPDRLEASYGRLVPILVKAVQELAERVAELESDLFFATKG